MKEAADEGLDVILGGTAVSTPLWLTVLEHGITVLLAVLGLVLLSYRIRLAALQLSKARYEYMQHKSDTAERKTNVHEV